MFHPTKLSAWVKSKLSPDAAVREADPEEIQKLLWSEVEVSLRQYLKALIESMLKAELEAHLGATRYERSEERKDYRNGSYARSLGTKHGTIPDVRVPRTRKGSFEPKVFERYERRAKSLDELIGTLFLNGVSTRKLGKITKELLGVNVTHATVGHIAGEISAKDCLRFQEKQLADEYRFLFLDGISAHIREIGVERGVLLCAVALKHDGTKEIIGARLADSESAEDWTSFLLDLKSRGLTGKKLELVTTDGGPGLIAALKTAYPFKKHQRCIAHKLRNMASKLKLNIKGACLGSAKLIFGAQSRTEAIRRFKAWKMQWILNRRSGRRSALPIPSSGRSGKYGDGHGP